MDDAEQKLKAARDENRRLRARVAELEAALRPFADLGRLPQWYDRGRDLETAAETQPAKTADCYRAAELLRTSPSPDSPAPGATT